MLSAFSRNVVKLVWARVYIVLTAIIGKLVISCTVPIYNKKYSVDIKHVFIENIILFLFIPNHKAVKIYEYMKPLMKVYGHIVNSMTCSERYK